jgi:hypothetical protein
MVSGTIATAVIAVLGWLSERGLNPDRRKLMTVVLAAGFLLAGTAGFLGAEALNAQRILRPDNDTDDIGVFQMNDYICKLSIRLKHTP